MLYAAKPPGETLFVMGFPAVYAAYPLTEDPLSRIFAPIFIAFSCAVGLTSAFVSLNMNIIKNQEDSDAGAL